VRADDRQVFFAGDTGYASHFREIARRFGSVDIALLPIGAYEPRWFMGPQHMNPDDAVRAHLDLQPRISIGTHFGCFRLTDEGMDDPVIELAAARERHQVPAEWFQVLETGETRVFQAGAESFSNMRLNAGREVTRST
jgi:L-ascorbate metabolism protein UlaG (beta-lactamase superfamily)